MRNIVVYGCYGIGGLAILAAIVVLTEGNTLLAGALVGSSISVFALGYVCDSLGAIRAALENKIGDETISHQKIAAGTHEEEQQPLFRLENGQIVLTTDAGDLAFPNMESMHQYLIKNPGSRS